MDQFELLGNVRTQNNVDNFLIPMLYANKTIKSLLVNQIAFKEMSSLEQFMAIVQQHPAIE